jgi:transposase
MSSGTKSELCQKGDSKEGRYWLRQEGVALLVSSDNQLPFFYREYEGNRHDSKLFERIVDDVFGSMKSYAGKPGRVNIVFDKGMNSDDNIAAMDARDDINFITCYSPFYAPELVRVKISEFIVVDTVKNQEMRRAGIENYLLMASGRPRDTGEKSVRSW